jgi:hypothetical protein
MLLFIFKRNQSDFNGRIFLFFNTRFLKADGYVPGCGLGEWDELANSQIQELKNEGRMEDLGI